MEKPIGEVLHYYNKIGVAVVKFNKTVKIGEKIRFLGAHTDFVQTVDSMQYEHQDIESANKNQDVGVRVGQKVHEGDEVYKAE